jgi:hypothetical protein
MNLKYSVMNSNLFSVKSITYFSLKNYRKCISRTNINFSRLEFKQPIMIFNLYIDNVIAVSKLPHGLAQNWRRLLEIVVPTAWLLSLAISHHSD